MVTGASTMAAVASASANSSSYTPMSPVAIEPGATARSITPRSSQTSCAQEPCLLQLNQGQTAFGSERRQVRMRGQRRFEHHAGRADRRAVLDDGERLVGAGEADPEDEVARLTGGRFVELGEGHVADLRVTGRDDDLEQGRADRVHHAGHGNHVNHYASWLFIPTNQRADPWPGGTMTYLRRSARIGA